MSSLMDLALSGVEAALDRHEGAKADVGDPLGAQKWCDRQSMLLDLHGRLKMHGPVSPEEISRFLPTLRKEPSAPGEE